MKVNRSIKIILAMFVGLSISLTACNKPAETKQFENVTFDGLNKESPIRVDEAKQTMTILASVNGQFFTEDTRHGMVSFDGSNARKAVFMGLVSTKDFYEGLLKIKAKPGNNMTFENMQTTYATGEPLVMTVKWEGAEREYDINEVIIDSNKKPIELVFGGNKEAAEDKKTGCLVCLDSCPVGIVSNSVYTYGAVEGRKEVAFRANDKVLPADNTLVAVTFSIKK